MGAAIVLLHGQYRKRLVEGVTLLLFTVPSIVLRSSFVSVGVISVAHGAQTMQMTPVFSASRAGCQGIMVPPWAQVPF